MIENFVNLRDGAEAAAGGGVGEGEPGGLERMLCGRDQTGQEASTKSCGHVSHLGRDGGEPGVAGHLLLQQVVEGQVEAGRGGRLRN